MSKPKCEFMTRVGPILLLMGAAATMFLLSACSSTDSTAAGYYEQERERSDANQTALRERLRHTQIDR